MICHWCRKGADLASGHDGTPIQAGLGVQNTTRLAKEMHDRCDGCDCQHRVRDIQPNLPEEVTEESTARFLEMIRNG